MSHPMLEQLCAERYGRLIAFATILSGSRAMAQDLVHDALLSVFSRSRNFPTLNAAEAYVRKAIASRFIDSKRRESRDSKAGARFGAQQTGTYADPEVPDSRLAAALQSLPPRERVCVALRYLDDLSIQETADALGLAPGSVKRYVADGVGHLNMALGLNEVVADRPTVPVDARKEAS